MNPADITLLVMAGGLGSRFGGDKQLVPVGPNGEAFLDYAIHGGLEAGVGKVVVVTRSELDAVLRTHLEQQHGPDLPLEIVHQDAFGPSRRKPWGTGHAVLSAAAACPGAVVVLNADDHYGPTGVQRTVAALREVGADSAVLLAFELGRTLSSAGAVSRGVCHVVEGELARLVETHGIRAEEGRIVADDPSSEFLLPEALDEQRAEGLLRIDVVRTDEPWIGVTSPDDLDVAREALACGGGGR